VHVKSSEPTYCSASKNAAVDILTDQGCIVEVSDLYAMASKAAATAEDLKGNLTCAEAFRYPDESKLSWEQGNLSYEIAKEQSKLAEADLVIFQFPMYWFGVPGILKGWFDWVLTNGFDFSQDEPYAVLSLTTGCRTAIRSLIAILFLQNGVLHHCGFQVLAPQVFWAPEFADAEERWNMLASWRLRLEGLLEEEPLSFTPLFYFEG
uniref:Ribosyldihydronicotinamide dehydrogenase [quinone]-like n=1 Tax=Poecilia reticulata TaxID=8081 RepID=A0A3P9MW52_POERE